jgi:hypothetical protein
LLKSLLDCLLGMALLCLMCSLFGSYAAELLRGLATILRHRAASWDAERQATERQAWWKLQLSAARRGDVSSSCVILECCITRPMLLGWKCGWSELMVLTSKVLLQRVLRGIIPLYSL